MFCFTSRIAAPSGVTSDRRSRLIIDMCLSSIRQLGRKGRAAFAADAPRKNHAVASLFAAGREYVTAHGTITSKHFRWLNVLGFSECRLRRLKSGIASVQYELEHYQSNCETECATEWATDATKSTTHKAKK